MIYFGEISIWSHWSCGDWSTLTVCTGFKRECLILKLIACHLFQGKYFYKDKRLKANFSKACRHLRMKTDTRKAPRQLRCSWEIQRVFGCASRCPHTLNLFLKLFSLFGQKRGFQSSCDTKDPWERHKEHRRHSPFSYPRMWLNWVGWEMQESIRSVICRKYNLNPGL